MCLGDLYYAGPTYDKKYIVDCIKKGKVNYATATYYLLARENEFIYESNSNLNNNVDISN